MFLKITSSLTLLLVTCLLLASCQNSYRDSYAGVTADEFSRLSDPIYFGDFQLIHDEFDEWKASCSTEDFIRRILLAAKTTHPTLQAVVSSYVGNDILYPAYRKGELENAKELYKYYPDDMPPFLKDELAADFKEMRELREQLGVS